ncbi:hypothetical protein MUP35_04415 [Patescibacteria group bacterium]|nr:hypothetical protein [Patescibacteria group bacterium]
MNELTYSEIQKAKKHKKVKLTLEKMAVIFMWLAIGFFIGRFTEAVIAGHIF